jgi:hypothetical protein
MRLQKGFAADLQRFIAVPGVTKDYCGVSVPAGQPDRGAGIKK